MFKFFALLLVSTTTEASSLLRGKRHNQQQQFLKLNPLDLPDATCFKNVWDSYNAPEDCQKSTDANEGSCVWCKGFNSDNMGACLSQSEAAAASSGILACPDVNNVNVLSG